MAINPGLEMAVLESMYYILEKANPTFRLVSQENVNIGINFLKAEVIIQEESRHRIKLLVGNAIGYGYDFLKKNEEGRPAKESFDMDLEMARHFSGAPHLETFVDERIIDNRYGCYITRIGDISRL